MKYFGDQLSSMHKDLNKIIRKKDCILQSKELFLSIHAALHLSSVSGCSKNAVDDLIFDLEKQEYVIMPTKNDETIAWVLWHIARIEDITMNILVAGEPQIFDDTWKNIINSPITDTGNALDDDGIMLLSKSLNIGELLNYRNQVGKRTRQIVGSLTADDMNRRFTSADTKKILNQGGVTQDEQSIWLLDFWSRKDVAGILLMPPTRHVILHLNDCCKWKQQIRTKSKFFRT